jgi:hypothetical protein
MTNQVVHNVKAKTAKTLDAAQSVALQLQGVNAEY